MLDIQDRLVELPSEAPLNNINLAKKSSLRVNVQQAARVFSVVSGIALAYHPESLRTELVHRI